MVTDLKGWGLSNDEQNSVVESFRRAKKNHMHWHAKPTIEKKPENIIILCGTNDISKDMDPEKIEIDFPNLSKSVSEESGSNVIISGLVPCKGYLNTKVRNMNNRLCDYCGNRISTSFKHDDINAKTHCNISDLHLNSKRVSLFNENSLSLLNTLDSEN